MDRHPLLRRQAVRGASACLHMIHDEGGAVGSFLPCFSWTPNRSKSCAFPGEYWL